MEDGVRLTCGSHRRRSSGLPMSCSCPARRHAGFPSRRSESFSNPSTPCRPDVNAVSQSASTPIPPGGSTIVGCRGSDRAPVLFIHPTSWNRYSWKFTCTVAHRAVRIQSDLITLNTNITHLGDAPASHTCYDDVNRWGGGPQ
jgi:hypothetical protein